MCDFYLAHDALRCCVFSYPLVWSCARVKCACSEADVYQKRLVHKQSCSQASPDNIAGDFRERLAKFRGEIDSLQYILLNRHYQTKGEVTILCYEIIKMHFQ